MKLDFDNVGTVGIVRDIPDYELPYAAWTNGSNVRFDDNKIIKFEGYSSTFESSTASSSVTIAPYFVMPMEVSDVIYWMYAGLNKVRVTSGAGTHTDITKASGDYSADAGISWNGGVLSGIGILNNGVDNPQQWGDSSAGPGLTKALKDLENWPASTTAKVVRPFQSYLVALDITESGVNDPRLLWWSHPAEAGDVPANWTYTDPASDSGRKGFYESDDILIDCLPLRNANMVYKQHSTWLMRHVGGTFVFSFERLFESIGILSRRCVQPFFHKHLVFTDNNDVVVHNGQTAESIIQRKWRKWLASAIDSTYYERSFVTPDYGNKEMYICFPQSGSELPDMALVWNWKENTFTARELDSIAHIGFGIVDPNPPDTFDGDAGTYDTDSGAIDGTAYNPTVQKLLMAYPNVSQSRLFAVGDTEQEQGVNMTAYVERTALPLGRQGQDGNIRVELNLYKEITRVIPRITGTPGGTVNIYVGKQDNIDDSVAWSGPFPFTIGSDYKVDCRVNCGRLPAIKFESTTNITWELSGYSVEFNIMGLR